MQRKCIISSLHCRAEARPRLRATPSKRHGDQRGAQIGADTVQRGIETNAEPRSGLTSLGGLRLPSTYKFSTTSVDRELGMAPSLETPSNSAISQWSSLAFPPCL